jgi:hypothetical protein
MATSTPKSQYPTPAAESTSAPSTPTRADLLSPALTFINPITAAPFPAIQHLFDYLAQNPTTAACLNDVYSHRGIFEAAATKNPVCDQKLTIDLSPSRVERIPAALQAELTAHGFAEILTFFNAVATTIFLRFSPLSAPSQAAT